MKSRTHRERGVTLIELLVVVGIIGIMLLVAAPNFFTYYRSNQIRATMRQFNSDIRSARQRAGAAQGRCVRPLRGGASVGFWTAGHRAGAAAIAARSLSMYEGVASCARDGGVPRFSPDQQRAAGWWKQRKEAT